MIKPEVFRQVREAVSAKEAAVRYGLTLDKKGWALCPFHDDKHPSMSFKNGCFRCWVCDAKGDSIDLVSKYYGISKSDAVRRLNADFRLGLAPDAEKQTSETRQAMRHYEELAAAHAGFESWRVHLLNRLDRAIRLGNEARQCNPDALTAQQAAALREQDFLEYVSDTLLHRTAEEQVLIFTNRGEIRACIDRILND